MTRKGTEVQPDLAAVARQAVVTFLGDAALDREGAPAAAPPAPEAAGSVADSANGQETADATAVRAAAISIATLERIESTAVRLEAEIAQALEAQAALRAGAGRAAESAVRAAQEARIAAVRAEEASQRASVILRHIGRYTAIVILMFVVEVALYLLIGLTVH
jgi:hypothetical protein